MYNSLATHTWSLSKSACRYIRGVTSYAGDMRDASDFTVGVAVATAEAASKLIESHVCVETLKGVQKATKQYLKQKINPF